MAESCEVVAAFVAGAPMTNARMNAYAHGGIMARHGEPAAQTLQL